jgi:hypothetical protein
LVITWAHIWTAQNRALKSTVHIEFRTPPSVLPLMEGGGGGPEWVLRSALRSAARKPAHRSMDHNGFRTPPGVLLLTKGGGSGMNIPFGGPLVTCGIVLLVSEVPSPTCCLTSRHPWTSSSTESTCPTCSRGRVTSHNFCQSLLSVP